MSATSAKEATRPAKRLRPSSGGKASNGSAPVLFRLPSISAPSMTWSESDSLSITNSTAAMMPSSNPVAASSAPVIPPVLNPANVHSPSTIPVTKSTATPVQSWWEQWGSGVMLIILIMALVIVTIMALKNHQVSDANLLAELEKAPASSSEALSSLSNLQVPDIQTGTLSLAPEASPSSPAENPGELMAVSTPEAVNNSSDNKPATQPSAEPIAQPDLLTATDSSSESLIPDDNQLTLESATSSPTTGSAGVQLKRPIPSSEFAVRTSSPADNAASNDSTSGAAGVPSTPRFETVSGASSAKPTPSTSTGSSPAMWDGVGSKAPPASPALNTESLYDPSSSVGRPQSPSVEAQLTASRNTSAVTSGSGNSGLGVTVGGGFKEPTTMMATNTPDLDSASLSRAYLEMSRATGQNATAPRSSNTQLVPASNASYTTPVQSAPPTSTANPYGPSAMQYGNANYGSQPYSAVSPNGLSYPSANIPAQPVSYPAQSYSQPSYPPQASTYPVAPAYTPSSQPATSYAPAAPTNYPAASPTSSQTGSSTSGLINRFQQSTTTSAPSNSQPAPVGLIGQTGYATQPTGDFVRPSAPSSNSYGVPSYGTPGTPISTYPPQNNNSGTSSPSPNGYGTPGLIR